MPELICKILHIGKTTYYKYVKEGYPIITFLLSFDKSELEELLKSGKIQKLENNKKLERYYQASKLIYLGTDFSKIIDDIEAEKFYFLLLNYIAKNGDQHYTFTAAAMSFIATVYIPSSTIYFDKILKFNIMPILSVLDAANLYIYISNIFSSEEYKDLINTSPELKEIAKKHIDLFIEYSKQYDHLIEKQKKSIENDIKMEFLQDMYNNFKDTKYFKEYIKKLDLSESELDSCFSK